MTRRRMCLWSVRALGGGVVVELSFNRLLVRCAPAGCDAKAGLINQLRTCPPFNNRRRPVFQCWGDTPTFRSQFVEFGGTLKSLFVFRSSAVSTLRFDLENVGVGYSAGNYNITIAKLLELLTWQRDFERSHRSASASCSIGHRGRSGLF